MTSTTTKTKSLQINDVVPRLEALEAEAAELREQVALARGTRQIRRPGEYSHHAVPTDKLYLQVQAALADKPYTFRDLCTHLDVQPDGENRIKSILVRLQRDGAPVVNLGNGSRAIWWIDTHGRIAAIVAERGRR